MFGYGSNAHQMSLIAKTTSPAVLYERNVASTRLKRDIYQ